MSRAALLRSRLAFNGTSGILVRMSRPGPIILVLLAGTLLFSGCNTFDSRAREMAPVYNALAPETQQRLRDGKVSVGDTPDMVYLALGEPSSKARKTTAAGQQEIWFYRTAHTTSHGSYIAGYETRYFYDAQNKRHVPYTTPVWRNYYTTDTYLRHQITFVDGKVTEIIE